MSNQVKSAGDALMSEIRAAKKQANFSLANAAEKFVQVVSEEIQRLQKEVETLQGQAGNPHQAGSPPQP